MSFPTGRVDESSLAAVARTQQRALTPLTPASSPVTEPVMAAVRRAGALARWRVRGVSVVGLGLAASLLAIALGGCRPIPARHDPFLTSQPGETGLPVLTYRWKHMVADRLSEGNPQEFASAAMFGSLLYTGSARGELQALSASDGEEYWARALGGITATPVADDRGRLYVGTIDGDLLCLNGDTGEELWRYASRRSIAQPPVLVDGLVIFSNESDEVYALDSESGKFRWQYKSDTPEEYTLRGHAGVAVAGDLAFSGFANGNLVALRQGTGSVAWLTSLKGDSDRFVDVDGTPVVSGETLYVTASAGGLFALDATTGLVRWRVPIEGAAGVVADDDRVYVTAADNGIYALDADGNLLWRQGTSGGGEPAQPVVSGDYVLYSLSEDGLFIADKYTGELHQYFDPGNGVSAAPLVMGDELYLLSNRGILYAMYLNRF